MCGCSSLGEALPAAPSRKLTNSQCLCKRARMDQEVNYSQGCNSGSEKLSVLDSMSSLGLPVKIPRLANEGMNSILPLLLAATILILMIIIPLGKEKSSAIRRELGYETLSRVLGSFAVPECYRQQCRQAMEMASGYGA